MQEMIIIRKIEVAPAQAVVHPTRKPFVDPPNSAFSPGGEVA
jgi:hypothetical protein